MVVAAPQVRSLSSETRAFYRDCLAILNESGLPYLVGGAYALERYTQIPRHTKDLDLFVQAEDCPAVLRLMQSAGYETQVAFEHWLGKVFHGDALIDIIFNSGNGVCPVDAEWFEHSVASHVWDLPVFLCPAEEMIWQKAYIMERKRFDGADVLHLIQARGPELDWERLLRRFAGHSHVLLAHLLLFEFAYPGERAKVPEHVFAELFTRRELEATQREARETHCNGPLLSVLEYLVDLDSKPYKDGRVQPLGNLTAEQVDEWTSAFVDR